MIMHKPPHPKDILKENALPELGLNVTQAAAALRLSRVALSRVLNGHAAVSADMALRLGDWLGNGADVWIRMQAAYDLWQASKRKRPHITPATAMTT